MRFLLPVLLLLMLGATSSGLCSSVDSLDAALRPVQDPALRWDNLEPGPQWVDGVKPVRNPALGFHTLSLRSGLCSRFLAEAGAWVRIGPLPEQGRERIEVLAGGGSGAELQLPLRFDESGRYALVEPDPDAPRVMRLRLAEDGGPELETALFLSRLEYLPGIDLYRQEIALPTESQRLHLGLKEALRHWKLLPGAPQAVELEGPLRLRLDSLLLYGDPPGTERLRRYQIRVGLDAAEPQRLELETSPETRSLPRQHSRPLLLGRRQSVYLQIPPGRHRLSLATSHPLLVRLLGHDSGDYLFPAANDPEADRSGQPLRERASATGPSVWALPAPDPQSTVLAELERLAGRSLRDNGRREGAMGAVSALRRAARQYAQVPDLQRLPAALLDRWGFWKDLAPRGPASLQRRYFSLPDLPLQADPDLRVYLRQHYADPGLVQSALFAGLEGGAREAVYALPRRSQPTRLRISVLRPRQEARLLLRLGDGPPMKLQIGPPPPVRGASGPSASELALKELERRDPSASPSLSGFFGRSAAPALLEPAASLEIPLEPGVSVLRISDAAGGALQGLAVQIRHGSPFGLEPDNLVHLLEAAGLSGRLMERLLEDMRSGKPRAPGPDSDLEDLRSHWLPLVRLVRSRAELFGANVDPFIPQSEATAPKAPLSPPKDSSAAQWQVEAARLAGELSRSLPGQRDELRLELSRALFAAGEPADAEQLLRGVLIYPEGDGASEALDRLEKLYRRRGSEEALLNLHAAELRLRPSAGALLRLAAALEEAGYPEMALMAALVLPEAQRPPDLLVRAAIKEDWDNPPPGLPQGHASLFEGLTEVVRGRFVEGLDRLDAAGAEGAPYARWVRRALGIKAALKQGDEALRRDAVGDWAQSQKEAPGPWFWKDASESITRCGGASLLYSLERDLLFPMYRASAAEPVRLRVTGPLRLRVNGRPLLGAGDKGPVNGWMEVREGTRMHQAPLTDVWSAPGLEIEGDPQLRPGRAQSLTLELSAGVHELEVSALGLDLLVGVERLAPAVETGLLPPLSEETLAAALQPATPVEERAPGLSVLRALDGHGGVAREKPPVPASYGLQAPEQALERAGAFLAALPGASPDPVSEAAGAGRWRHAAELCEPALPEQARRAAALLARLAEAEPVSRLWAETRLRSLADARPEDEEIASMLGRVSRYSAWVPVASLSSGLGSRTLNALPWQSDNPQVRLRRALVGAADGDILLWGEDAQLLSAYNPAPAVLRLRLHLLRQPHRALHPLDVALRLDDEPERLIRLGPGMDASETQVSVPRGRHSLRMRLVSPLEGQMAAVRLMERSGVAETAMEIEPQRRLYHLASQEQPLRADLIGPTWLRVDRLRGEEVHSRYQAVDEGWQTLQFTPEAGSEESLRLWAREALAPEPPAGHGPEPRAPPVLRVEGPLVTSEPSGGQGTLGLRDVYALGRQEDGTWEARLTLARRRALEEDRGGREAERFAEGRILHRYYDDWRRIYWKSTALARVRERGGPTLGLLEDARWNPRSTALDFGVSAGLYLQNPGGERFAVSGPLEWLAGLRLTTGWTQELSSRARHRPELALFGRMLSLGRDHGYRIATLDQDVYSSYKRRHRYGLSAGDTLFYRPWLDTLWSAGLSVGTNEDFSLLQPDHLRFQAAWEQLIGLWEAGLDYGFTWYFADGDRSGSSSRQRLGLSLLRDFWTARQDRLRLQLKLGADVDRGDLSAELSGAWIFSAGRALKDFRPGEIGFSELRSWKIPLQENNALDEY